MNDPKQPSQRSTVRETGDPGHIVLIHGAWQGSWAFDAWRPMLQDSGWHVHAVDLPDENASLQTYTRHVVDLVSRIGEPVVLLGHSGGGITASQVAEAIPDSIRCLVYLAGMMLPSGLSFGDLIALCRPEQTDPHFFDGIGTFLIWNEDHTQSRVPADAAIRVFLHDCDPSAAAAAASLLRGQPDAGRAMRNTLTFERFGTVPRIYVEALQDRSVKLALQRKMQALQPGALTISLDCGHVPQLAQPRQLTERLSAALALSAGAARVPSSGRNP